MKIKPQALLTLIFSAGIAAAAALLVSQRLEHHALTGRLHALSVSSAAAPPAEALREVPLNPAAAREGEALRRRLVKRILEGGEARGLWKSIQEAEPLLEGLSVEELKGVIGAEPPVRFTATAGGLHDKPEEDIAEASVKTMALRQLCVLAPERALTMCVPRGAPEKIPTDCVSNMVVAWGLRHWVPQNPAAALRWVEKEASWLSGQPKGFTHLVLGIVAGEGGGMQSACDLARREGVDLTRAMASLSGFGTLKDVDTLMAEAAAQRAGASGAFTAEAAKGSEEITRQIGRGFGFGEARGFVERWMAGHPGAEEAALIAAQSAFSRHADPGAEEAADWLMGFIPEERRAGMAEKLVSAWAEEDFSAPARWLKKNPEAAWRDAGLAALCRRVAPFDPGAASELAAGISDGALRNSASAPPPAD